MAKKSIKKTKSAKKKSDKPKRKYVKKKTTNKEKKPETVKSTSKVFKYTNQGATGGRVKSVGIDIQWQDGSEVDEDGNKSKINGATPKDLTSVLINRIEYLQSLTANQSCGEYVIALNSLNELFLVLDSREKRRKISGLNEGDKELF